MYFSLLLFALEIIVIAFGFIVPALHIIGLIFPVIHLSISASKHKTAQ